MSTLEAYQEKANAQLIEWEADINKLRARAMRAHADAKLQHETTVADLEKRRIEVKTKLDELRSKGEKAFVELRIGLDRAMTEMKTAIDRASQQIQ